MRRRSGEQEETDVPRVAEVAGAGLGGLAVATALARHGWRVRVHERASELRMFGAGIWLWENGLRSLRLIGAEDQAVAGAQRIKEWAVVDQHGSELFRRSFTDEDKMMLPVRADLYQALIDAARGAGVEIVTDSAVAGAEPDGVLVLADGSRLPADLVVAADGAHSRIREALQLTDKISYLREGYIRLLVPKLPGDEEAVITEAWHGSRRLLYCPSSAEQHYVAFSCLMDDRRGRSVPVDKESWRETFPTFTGVIDRIGGDGRWDRGMTVRCRAWSEGKVVLVGDAAHAQAPNLAQGANMTFTNAVSLAAAVSGAQDVPSALRTWEARERALTDHVQRWSHGYGWMVSMWPENLADSRSKFLQLVTGIPWVDRQLNRAARHIPVGDRS
ncbi:FAD-dependent monooxygenase [Pseudonocardia sp. KRD-188]|uniref:FAD-dependent oxidoreductase n=1 Tax=Pseudonocardia oceani TaxID=2792013 RepID=UPI001C4A095D|nr:NAD(P)/FAD-dependent oxidoreductase [Pseudonocardia oceani]MBW0088048.1 FAD-dependent monooxygenase [Pseudonocardia oceani]MBW0107519.1 FAD-dependent monooxygenase [Pseudonocardia oceani]